ncbi:unnamed protein product [Calypogeia fissa]
MGAKAKDKIAKTFDEDDGFNDGFNNFEDFGPQEEEFSSDGESDDVGEDRSADEKGMDDSGRLRLRADISLDGEEYAGKQSSRKEALEDSEEDEVDLEDADLSARLRAAYGVGSSDDEEDEEKVGEGDLTGQDDELDALTREYEKLREEEEKGIEILKGQERDSQQKGQAVQNQKALWDRALEVRISLQKILSSANRLPREQAKLELCQENEEVKEAYAKLTDSAMNALDCLLDLETLLIENNSVISQSYSSRPNENGKREALEDTERESVSDRVWEKMDGLYSTVVPYRDNSLDRWQRKTQIYTGAVGQAKLRAFNQSVSQQVATTMRDSSRLIVRMRLKRDSVHVLGQQTMNEVKEDSVANKIDDTELLGRNAVEDDGDPETFDDSEFYQQLLREFLEQSDPSALGSMALYASGRQHSKKRKQVDRRASKGRKLRYNVFEPLRNFMAPKPMVLPSIATQLFSNLFGQKSRTPKAIS